MAGLSAHISRKLVCCYTTSHHLSTASQSLLDHCQAAGCMQLHVQMVLKQRQFYSPAKYIKQTSIPFLTVLTLKLTL